nr:angiogenin-like [Pelodiscus sinensis]|eukprot:XP_006112717.1 angiogenin-like [Pelodiscus sinensis]
MSAPPADAMGLRAAPLLLLTALLLAGASAGRERDPDRYKHFLNQHYDPSPTGHNARYCNRKMRSINGLRKPDARPGPKDCKETNTFIHDNINSMRAVCTPQGGEDYVTPAGQRMRRSRGPLSVTTCTLSGGSPPNNCEYRATHGARTIVIACDGQGRPEHFDENWIVAA